MSRLHFITPWQGRKPSVLSEELLLAQKREEKTYVFVPPFFGFSKMLLEDCLHFIQAIPHFWQKKWRAEWELIITFRVPRQYKKSSRIADLGGRRQA